MAHQAYIRIDGQDYGPIVSPSLPLTPQQNFAPVIQQGDSNQVSDLTKSALHFTDWGGGMGQAWYDETAALDSFRDSDCDTRFQRSLVLPPPATQLGAPPGGTQRNTRYLATGISTAPHFIYARGSGAAKYFRSSDSTWQDINTGHATSPNMAHGATAAHGKFYVTVSDSVYMTSTMTAWTLVGPATGGQAVADHDGKLYTVGTDTTSAPVTATLYRSANAQLGTGATWAASGSLVLGTFEYVRQLVEWRDRTGRRALYLVTTGAIYGYDDTTETFHRFTDLADPPAPGDFDWSPFALVHPGDDNLYVCLGTYSASVMQFTGSTIEDVGPNARGGLAADRVPGVMHLAANNHYLYAFCSAFRQSRPEAVGGATRVLARASSGGWHTVYTGADYAGSPVASIDGGGWAGDTLYVAINTGAGGPSNNLMVSLPDPDESALPHNATARTYHPGPLTHTTAKTDAGTINIKKCLLHFQVRCMKSDESYGLPAGAAVQIEYRLDGGAWASAGTVTDATAFPAKLFVNGGRGATFYELEWRATLTRGAATTATPNVVQVSPHYIRQPEVRYDLRQVRIALSAWEAFELRRGRSAAQAAAALYALAQPGPLHTVSFGGGLNPANPLYATMNAAQISVLDERDPVTGASDLVLQIRDLS